MKKKNNAVSIKDKLKNIAKKQKIQTRLVYLSYVFGRFLFRVSKSDYHQNFILKGGVLLYCIDTNIRQTVDIDFLIQDISISEKKLETIVREICQIEGQDPVIFDIENIQIKETRIAQQYKGYKVLIPFYFGSIRETLQIDLGFDDIVYPKPEKINYPSLLNDDPFFITGYNIETFLAEKIHSVYNWGISNTRMKDYYDLFKLTEIISVKQIVLKKAIYSTFKRRKTKILSTSLLNSLNSDSLDSDFSRFLKNNRLKLIDFKLVRERLKDFFIPVFILLENNKAHYNTYWDSKGLKWVQN